MGNWKLGYPDGLDAVSSESDGRDLYAPWSVTALALSAKSPVRVAGQADYTSSSGELNDSGKFETDQFNGGFLKMLSGDGKGEVFKVTDTTTDKLVCESEFSGTGISGGDYYEVINGSTSFTFPDYRSPVRKDYKRVFTGTIERFPYYDGGVYVPMGMEGDDFVLKVYLTNWSEWRTLELLLNTRISYAGYDAESDSSDMAPLVLEEGSHDADSQYLVFVKDYKLMHDGSNGKMVEAQIHMQNTASSSYRGI